jgi:hypothetical protein
MTICVISNFHQLTLKLVDDLQLTRLTILDLQYGTHHSYVLVAENEILKLNFPAKRH